MSFSTQLDASPLHFSINEREGEVLLNRIWGISGHGFQGRQTLTPFFESFTFLLDYMQFLFLNYFFYAHRHSGDDTHSFELNFKSL
jgi:hypothetical protein